MTDFSHSHFSKSHVAIGFGRIVTSVNLLTLGWIMLIRKLTANRVFIICGRTDMRLGMDGLAAIVSGTYEMNPFES